MAETIAVRIAPIRRIPSSRQTNAAAVARPIAITGHHSPHPSGIEPFPVSAAKAKRPSDAPALTHIALVSGLVRRSTRSVPTR
jgi:hypothetical protein